MSGIGGRRPAGQWLDLSQLIYPGMPVYPGDPPVRIHRLAAHDRDGCQLSELAMSCHSGTHLDAPLHYHPDGAAIDQIDPDRLVLTAWVSRIDIDGQGCLDAAGIDWSGWRPGDGLLLAVPCSSDAVSRFSFASGSHDILTRHNLPLIGTNMDTFVEAGDPLGEPGLHLRLLGAGTLLLENLSRLETLAGRRVDLIALPLRIAGADGAPARVIARAIACNPASDDI